MKKIFKTALITLLFAPIAFINAYGSTNTLQKVNGTYWCAGFKNGDAPYINLKDIPKEYNVIYFAFAGNDGDVHVTIPDFDKDTITKDQAKAEIQEAQQNGRKVVLSLGGALSGFKVVNDQDAKTMADDINNIINEWNFDGLDLDLETGVVSSNPDMIAKAVENVVDTQRAKNPDFMLTGAPEWSDLVSANGWNYKLITKILKDKESSGREGWNYFTYLSPQLYNQGTSWGPWIDGKAWTPAASMSDYVDACTYMFTNKECAQQNYVLYIPADKFVIALPSNVHASSSATYYLDGEGLTKAWNGLKSGEFKLDTLPLGFMNWSADWDHCTDADHTPWDFGNTVDSLINNKISTL